MTEEQIKQKANDFINNKICDFDGYPCGYLPSTVEEMLIEFATETTKELQETNHRLTKQLEELDTDNDYLEEQNNTLTQNLEVKENCITELEKQIEELKENTDYYGERARVAESFIVKQRERENELQEENKDIQQSCENYYNEMRTYKNQVADLKNVLLEKDEIIEKLQKENQGFTNLVAKYMQGEE